MYDAYDRIFTRCGLKFRAVEADNGLIGGTTSHEFMVLAETGEETLVYDEEGSYAANVERAELLPPDQEDGADQLPLETVHTPGTKTVEAVCALLQVSPDRLVKTLLYETPAHEVVAILIRGDHEANTIKICRHLGITEIALASKETVAAVSPAPLGFAGPVGLQGIRILADHGIKAMRNFVVGGNKSDTHLKHANWGRDFTVEAFLDLRRAQAGDPSPRSDGRLHEVQGIEVGHVFLLGTKYSKAMNATVLDAQGQEVPAIMGCYGIGVSRTAAAAVNRIMTAKAWCGPSHCTFSRPPASADGVGNRAQNRRHLVRFIDCRRSRSPVGRSQRTRRVKFNDADLIGAPFHLIIGEKGLAQGVVEFKRRKTGEVVNVQPDAVQSHVKGLLSAYDLPVEYTVHSRGTDHK